MSRRSSPRVAIDLTPVEAEPKPRALAICPACGSNWFRRCQVQQFSRERGTPSGRPDLIVLVCRCATPRKPRLGGLAASAAFAREQQALVDSIDQALAQIKESNDSRRLAALAAAQLWPKARLDEIAAEISKLEGEIGRRLARADKRVRQLMELPAGDGVLAVGTAPS